MRERWKEKKVFKGPVNRPPPLNNCLTRFFLGSCWEKHSTANEAAQLAGLTDSPCRQTSTGKTSEDVCSTQKSVNYWCCSPEDATKPVSEPASVIIKRRDQSDRKWNCRAFEKHNLESAELRTILPTRQVDEEPKTKLHRRHLASFTCWSRISKSPWSANKLVEFMIHSETRKSYLRHLLTPAQRRLIKRYFVSFLLKHSKSYVLYLSKNLHVSCHAYRFSYLHYLHVNVRFLSRQEWPSIKCTSHFGEV